MPLKQGEFYWLPCQLVQDNGSVSWIIPWIAASCQLVLEEKPDKSFPINALMVPTRELVEYNKRKKPYRGYKCDIKKYAGYIEKTPNKFAQWVEFVKKNNEEGKGGKT